MDNNQNNNGQTNTPEINQPINQNNIPDNNQTANFNTYSSIPSVFHNKNAVSQNRSIPPTNKSNTPRAKQATQHNSQVRQPVQNPTAPAQPPIRNAQPKRVSEGRAFVEEFYPQTSQPMATPQGRPQPTVGRPIERPMGNSQGRPQPPVDRPVERPMGNFQARPQPPVDRPIERPMGNTQSRPQPPVDRPIERPMGNFQARPQPPVDRPIEKPLVNSQGRPQPPVDRPAESNPMQNAQSKPFADVQGAYNPAPFGAESPIGNASENPHKHDVKYNLHALTPPDKKSTSVIIAVYVIVVVLLLVGVIGYAVTSDSASGFTDGFSDLLDNISTKTNTSDNSDSFQGNANININADTSYYGQNTLYYTSEDSSEYEVVVSAPYGYEYNESANDNHIISFFNPASSSICDVWLTSGDANDSDKLMDDIMNPSDEDSALYAELGEYSTTYGIAEFYKLDYTVFSETYAFINIDEDVLLAVKISEHFEIEDIDDEEIMSSIKEVLDSVIIL